MKIGIIGAGYIGETLVRKLSAAGHTVSVANSRGPDTLRDLANETGATAVFAADAVNGVDVVILSVPPPRMPSLKGLLANAPPGIPVIDTSNYYPLRDGHIPELDDGKVESVWVQEQIGRPIIKAWNAVLAGTLKRNGQPRGQAGRIAIPVAGDDQHAKQIAMGLVDATGFDAIDAGSIAESWRIQTGNPAYCTELTLPQLEEALKLADKALAPMRRDAGMQVVLTFGEHFSNDELLKVNRAVVRFPQ